ncbi:MAG: FHA domain-containing protein [Polyangiaceae bacterium]|nr:FHA domain-containing protein [Polyangiaceae bacterium]
MPITVTVRSMNERPTGSSTSGASKLPSLTFDGPRIVLGRGAGADVRLPDPSVSVRHATIRAQGAEYAIVDEGSTNGTFMGGVRLVPQTPRIIKSGDLARIGRLWLEFVIGQKVATSDLGLATRELAFVLVRNALNSHGDDTVAKLRVVEGPNIGLVLRIVEPGRVYLIGRAEHCDLSLADPHCSREHASVTKRAGQVFLRDYGSSHGVVLGGARIPAGCDVPWRSSFMARIGNTVLALDEPVAAALASLEAAVDEQLADKDVPGPPQMRSRPPSARGAIPVSRAAFSSRASSRPGSTPRVASPSKNGEGGNGGEGSKGGNAPAAGNAPPPADAGAIAPMMYIDGSTSPPPRPIPVRRGKRKVTVIDVVVITLAVVIIVASIGGLAWVLK